MKEKILVSACLLGTPCRYDGRSKPSEKLNSLNDLYELIPVCPEVLGGLSTPRLPCEIQNGRVIRSDGKDMTEFYKRGAEIALEIAKKHNCTIAILKENSPSCSPHQRYDGSFTKKLIDGNGLTAELLSKNKIRVLGENDIDLI